MKLLSVLAATGIAASAHGASEKQAFMNFEDVVSIVNAANTTWRAAAPTDRFGDMSDAKVLCGTWQKGHPLYKRLPEKPEEMNLAMIDLPTDFDARSNWKDCTVISKVRDQSSCGSCWAFGSTEAFEDRRCIATKEDIEFSSQDTAACCKGFACGLSMGCNGGQPSAALQWMTTKGVVTGGDYYDIGSGKTCLPYSLKPCAHHVPPTSKYPKCPSSEYPTPSCSQSCSESKYGTDYSSDKKKGGNAYSVSGVEKIKQELMTNGPLAVAFTVYEDFVAYKSGVYKHTTGQALGGHAVEMIGWGVEDGEDYWLVKNSWNEQWGDGGFFKIAHNECGIEDDVTAITF